MFRTTMLALTGVAVALHFVGFEGCGLGIVAAACLFFAAFDKE